MRRASWWVVCAIVLPACASPGQPNVLDGFEEPAAWKVVTPEGVRLNVGR